MPWRSRILPWISTQPANRGKTKWREWKNCTGGSILVSPAIQIKYEVWRNEMWANPTWPVCCSMNPSKIRGTIVILRNGKHAIITHSTSKISKPAMILNVGVYTTLPNIIEKSNLKFIYTKIWISKVYRFCLFIYRIH